MKVFGGKASKEKIHTFKQSKNFLNGKFVNQIPTSMDTSVKTMVTILRDFIKENPKGRPDRSIPVESLNNQELGKP